MHAVLMNPLVEAVVNVLKTMAFTEPKPGQPFVRKRPEPLQGDVTAVIGVTGSMRGSIALSFTEAAILLTVTQMFGEQVSEISPEVEDVVGELCNMICGNTRRTLEGQGYHLQGALPMVINGKGHRISSAVQGPAMIVPFTIGDNARLFVEACFEDPRPRAGAGVATNTHESGEGVEARPMVVE
jgi:chemotaxis protein CheX